MKVKKLNGKSNVLGKNVKKYRELRHLTQRELSDKIALLGIDIYHSDISQIENQKLLLKDFEIIAICKALNISYEYDIKLERSWKYGIFFSDVVALKIKELMKEKDISIYKLETLTGVYSSTITLFLNRKTKTIRLENLLYICEALGTNLSKFFADERFNEAEAQNWLKRNKEK